MNYFNSDYVEFFKELSQNNHKDWFDLNRSRYEKNIKLPFKEFTQLAIDSMALIDPDFNQLLAKDCIFRINRDVRFSKDKQPYKLMCSAIITPNGKKSKAINGIYFEFTPEHVRFYSGVYEIEKDDLFDVREGICSNLSQFSTLINAPEFIATFGHVRGEKNKIIHPDFRESAQEQALIFNKQWYFYVEYPADDLLKGDILAKLLNAYTVARPLSLFFDKFI